MYNTSILAMLTVYANMSLENWRVGRITYCSRRVIIRPYTTKQHERTRWGPEATLTFGLNGRSCRAKLKLSAGVGCAIHDDEVHKYCNSCTVELRL